jgi:hypothetical protein
VPNGEQRECATARKQQSEPNDWLLRLLTGECLYAGRHCCDTDVVVSRCHLFLLREPEQTRRTARRPQAYGRKDGSRANQKAQSRAVPHPAKG